MNRAELISKMDRQVNKVVKHYKEDFYHYDINTLFALHMEQKPVEYLWVIRDMGTHFFDGSNKEYLDAVDHNWEHTKQYLITFDGSQSWNMKLISNNL